MSLTETFSNLTSARIMRKFDQSSVVHIQAVFGTLQHVACWCSEKGIFRHLSKHVFRSVQFRKYISSEGQLFFQNIQKLT